MENGLLYVLAFSAMAIALFACILPQAQLYSEISGVNDNYDYLVYNSDLNTVAVDKYGVTIASGTPDTTIQAVTKNNSVTYLETGTYENVTLSITNIHNFILTGDSNATFYTKEADNTITVQDSTNIEINGFHLKGNATATVSGQTAIVVADSTSITVESMSIERYGYDGVTYLHGCTEGRILNNNITFCYDDGINPGGGGGSGTTDTLVSGNYIANCTNDGIHISDLSSRTTASENWIVNCGKGIGFYNSSNNLVANNVIVNCGYGVKSLSGVCSNESIIGNNILGSTLGEGVRLEHTSNYCKISQNRITGCTTYSISVLGDAIKTEIFDNTLEGGTRGIMCYVIQSIVSFNTIVLPSSYGIAMSGGYQYYGNLVNNNLIEGGASCTGIYINCNSTGVIGNTIRGCATSGNAAVESATADWNYFTDNLYVTGLTVAVTGANSLAASNFAVK